MTAKKRRRKISLSRRVASIDGEFFRDMPKDETNFSHRKRAITLPIVRTGRDERDIVVTIRVEL